MTYSFVIRIYSKDDDILAEFSAEAEITQNINKGAKPIRGGKGNALIGLIGGDNSKKALVFSAGEVFVEKNIPLNGTTIVFDNPYQMITFYKCNIQLSHNDVIISGDSKTVAKK